MHLSTTSRIALSTALAASLLVTGCSAVKDDRVTETVKEDRVQSRDKISQITEVEEHEGPANVRHHDVVWLGDSGVRSRNGRPLPSEFEGPEGFSFYTAQPMSLADVADEVSALTGLPVTLDDTVQRREGAGTIDYIGSLSGFLNKIAARRDASWRYKDGVINFYGTETRTFHLAAPSLAGSMTANFQSTNGGASSSSGGEGEGGSNQSGYSAESAYDIWAEVDSSLQNMLDAQESATYSLNRQTQTITVTASGPTLARVEQFVKEQNEILEKQVAVNIHVLTVDTNKIDRSGFNFDLLAGQVGETLTTASLGNVFGPAVGAALAGMTEDDANPDQVLAQFNQTVQNADGGVLNDDAGDNASVTYSDFDVDNGQGEVSAAKAIVELSKTIDQVSLKDSVSTITTSAQPAPIQVSNQRNFVAETSVTNTVDAGTSVEITPGTLTTGMSGTVTPRIQGPGELMINYQISLSDLTNLQTFSASGSSVQLPEIDTRAFMQTLKARDGETIVVAAFEQTENRTNDGLGLTSKSAGTERSRKATVILLTPTILDTNDQLVVNN